jgi:hypothetical protein
MTTTLGNCYKMSDFENIIFNGFQYTLPHEVINNLLELQKKIGSVGSTNPNHNHNHNHKYKPSQNVIHTSHKPFNKNVGLVVASSTDWKQQQQKTTEEKALKKTLDVSNRSGIDLDIATIRVSLNKISAKNYEAQSQNIIKIVESYIEENHLESITKIANTIFEISSTNTFLSKLNAKLYSELVGKSSVFLKITDDFIESYKKTFNLETMRQADTEMRNKENDRRKAMTQFLIHLVNEEVILSSVLVNVVSFLLFELFEKYVECKSFIGEVDEIAENIYLFITLGYNSLKTTNEWDAIYDKICFVDGLKAKEKPGLSTRALFKFKDILDFV